MRLFLQPVGLVIAGMRSNPFIYFLLVIDLFSFTGCLFGLNKKTTFCKKFPYARIEIGLQSQS